MKIAVTHEDGNVFQHFGHTRQFKVYDVNGGKVAQAWILGTNGSGHGALAEILKKEKVDKLICGGIGGGAKRALSEAGIELYAGARGDADKAVSDLLAGSLQHNPDVECGHHGEHHHGDGHGCGHHGEHPHGEGHGHHGEHACRRSTEPEAK